MKMLSSTTTLSDIPLDVLKKQESRGRDAAKERLTRLLYHTEDLERRLADLERIMDEQLEVGSQIWSF